MSNSVQWWGVYIDCQFLTVMNLLICFGLLCVNSRLVNMVINKVILLQSRKSCKFPTINTIYVIKVIYT